ncbi:hypothetical protein HYV10_02465 [Candidatus Dependentiae bacterium]|nr:hypothetical protein [Candidatus Dependentiae bacterium]
MNCCIKKYVLYIILVLNFKNSFLYSENQKIEQLKMGNLALPSSQQPGPLIGFGQNMLDKGELQIFSYFDYLRGNDKKFTEIIPTLLYAFTDNFSLFLQMPVAAKFEENGDVFRGIQELIVQFEYSFYNTTTETATNQISIVSNIALTPDSPTKNIARGLATTNIFLGFTASHMSTTWYPFISVGGILTVRDDKMTKHGNQILYQCGLSRNIMYKENTYILNWMLELDGIYKQKDTICCKVDQNSGSNMILFGPSVWFSTQRFVLQAGISGIIYEKLSGVQNKNKYFVAIDCGWKF